MIVNTTSNSSSVKPRELRCVVELIMASPDETTALAADIGVVILTARRAIGAIGHQDEISFAWLVEVIVVPGILRQRTTQVGTIPGIAAGIVFHEAFQCFRIAA